MKSILIVSAAAVALLSHEAMAQSATPAASPEPNDSGLREIIVTAQRRDQRLQEVPISVNVVSGEQLAARGAANTADLINLVPGLQFTTAGGGGTPFLRGIGSTNGDINVEPSVATYIDGVYIATNYSNISSLNNIERIEVLKGPQGTLFGRNATGGVIQVVTRNPTSTPMVEASLGYGNYNTLFGSLYATTGLGSNLSANVAVQGSSQGDGWGHSLVSGEDTYKSDDFSVRGKLLWEPTADFSALLIGDYQFMETGTGDYRLPPGVLGFDGVAFPDNRYDTRSDVLLDNEGSPHVRNNQYGTSLRLDYRTDSGTFVSISAYRKTFGVAVFDPDMTPIHLQETVFPTRQRQFSQELQYITPSSWPVSVTAGLYFFDSKAGYRNAKIGGLGLSPNFDTYVTVGFTNQQHTQSLAGYIQADAKIAPATSLTMGLRYTHERSSANIVFVGNTVPTDDIGYDKPTWRIALDHAFTPDVHVYASYNRGVKAGGFDLEDFAGGNSFDPEKLDAYEVGLKTEFLNRSVRLNLAAFRYDYENIQVQVIPAGQNTVSLARTTNAAKARIQGFDADFAIAPVRGLTINGGLAYLDGKYLDFQNTVSFPLSPLSGSPQVIDASGNPTVRTPEWSGNLGATYDVETSVGHWVFTGSASYNGSFAFSPDDLFRQPNHTLVNASINWTEPNGRFGITAFVRNLTDETYFQSVVPSAFGPLSTYGAPRTYGASLRVKLGG